MIRTVFLFSILSYLFNGFSQSENIGVKCDSFALSNDSKRAIVYKKKKMGIYDLSSGEYKIPLSKNYIQILQEIDFYIHYGEDEIQMASFGAHDEKRQLDVPKGKNIKMFFTNPDLQKEERWIKQDDSLFNFISDKNEFVKELLEEILVFEMVWKKELLIQNYYSLLETPNDNTEKDQTTYISKSGVFNPDNQQWLIPPVYYRCFEQNNYFFCAKRIQNLPTEGDFQGYFEYDVYQLNSKKDGVTSVVESLRQGSESEFLMQLGYDTFLVNGVRKDEYRFIENGKMGQFRFQLFNAFFPDLIWEEQVAPKHDFVLSNTTLNRLITFDTANGMKSYRQDENKEWELEDNDQIELIYCNQKRKNAKDTLVRIKYEDNLSQIKYDQKLDPQNFTPFGLSKLNDSLLLVYDGHIPSVNFDPIPVMDEWGENVQFSEELGEWTEVYLYPSEPVLKQSGIYNLKSNEWFCAPNYFSIQPFPGGFLYTTLHYDKNVIYDYKVTPTPSFSFQTFDGNWLFEDVLANNQLEIEPYLTTIFKADTVEKANIFAENQQGEQSYKIIANGYQQLISLNNFSFEGIEMLTKPKEFVHYNSSVPIYYWLENDSLYMQVMDSTFRTSVGRYGLVGCRYVEKENKSLLRVFVYDDLSNLNEYDFTYPQYQLNHHNSTFYLFEDNLIVMDENKVWGIAVHDDWLISEMDCEAYTENDRSVYETELSAVWKKERGVWSKKTVNYASIDAMPFGGFRASTPNKVTIDCVTYEEVVTPKRYIILSEDFKPVSYYDYFDFEDMILDNGMALKTGNGYFFVSQEGEVITTDKWDIFEVGVKQLKAIRFKRDTLGNILEGTVDEEAYFEW